MSTSHTVRKLAVTALGLGCLPLAPGTWGSLGAAGIGLLLFLLVPWPWSNVLLAGGLIVILGVGQALGPWAERYYGENDPKPFVLDEVAGQWLTCLLAGVTLIPPFFGLAAVPFVMFRLFDIWKPFPIRRIETLPGGWGIMLDDLFAALYAGLVSRGLIVVFLIVFV